MPVRGHKAMTQLHMSSKRNHQGENDNRARNESLEPGKLSTGQSRDVWHGAQTQVCLQEAWVGVVFCLVPGVAPWGGGAWDLENSCGAPTLWIDIA